MPQLSATLARVVTTRYGVVTTEQLLVDGFTQHSIRRMVTQEVLIRVHKGVYRHAVATDSFEARCVAACLADSRAVVTGPAAARLWGFRHVFRPLQPVVLVEHDRTPLTRGVELRRTNVLEADDWSVRPDGIRVASPARAWFDCARDLNDERFEMLTEWVLDHHASVPTLWRMRRRMSSRGRPGLARVNRVLSQRQVWQRPAGSGLELRALQGLERRGVVGLVRQFPVRLANGIVIHPDAALPEVRWALEIDHVTWHGGRLDAQRDKGRDRGLRRVGWQVDRVTDVELDARFDETIDEIVDLIAMRARSFVA